MKPKFYQEKGFFLTLFTSILIISVALITEHKKTLFVHETGNIKIIGSLGVLLAIGLLLKWKYVRQILGVIVLIALVGIIFIMTETSKEFLLSYSILLITLVLVEYFLFFSRSVINYVSNK